MCGIVFLNGPDANKRIANSVERLAHRGPDDKVIWRNNNSALGFTRLIINGTSLQGRQPYQSSNFVGAVNGEIFNHAELAQQLRIPIRQCDTDMFFTIYDQFGEQSIELLDGFYSAVLYQPCNNTVTCLRDHIGKKPLFFGRSEQEWFLTSELKALNTVKRFEMVPLGVTRIDLSTGELFNVQPHTAAAPTSEISEITTSDSSKFEARASGLTQILDYAVRKRLPDRNQPVGLFLSGGVDSSIIAALAHNMRDDIVFFTLGDRHSADVESVRIIIKWLDLKDVRTVELPTEEQMPELMRAVVYSTESFNPSIISNGIATYLLAEAASKAGIKVILSGEGADELFGGYHQFAFDSPWHSTRAQLISDMPMTELRRLDMCCMAHGIEPRCPFLDREVRAYSDNLDFEDMYDAKQNKISLRNNFRTLLPIDIINRKKTSLDVGSGIRRLVVNELCKNGEQERSALLKIWKQLFSFNEEHEYFHRYTVFDDAIDRRGISQK